MIWINFSGRWRLVPKLDTARYRGHWYIDLCWLGVQTTIANRKYASDFTEELNKVIAAELERLS